MQEGKRKSPFMQGIGQESCILSRIVGRNITHQVVWHRDNYKRKIVSAGFGRGHEWESIFKGTYTECLRFLNKKRFDRW